MNPIIATLLIYFFYSSLFAGEQPLFKKGSTAWYAGKSVQAKTESMPGYCKKVFGEKAYSRMKTDCIGKPPTNSGYFSDEEDCETGSEKFVCEEYKKLDISTGEDFEAVKKIWNENQLLPPADRGLEKDLDQKILNSTKSKDVGLCQKGMASKQSHRIQLVKKNNNLIDLTYSWTCESEFFPISKYCEKGIRDDYTSDCFWRTCPEGWDLTEKNWCIKCSEGKYDKKQSDAWTYSERESANCKGCVLCAKELK